MAEERLHPDDVYTRWANEAKFPKDKVKEFLKDNVKVFEVLKLVAQIYAKHIIQRAARRLEEEFKRARFDDRHMELGDIRLTLGEQKRLVELIKWDTEEEKDNELGNPERTD